MVRMAILFISLSAASAFASTVPTEHNQEALEIFNSPDGKAPASVLQNIPKRLKCGDTTVTAGRFLTINVNSHDARYVYFSLGSSSSYDLFQVNVDDLRELNNDRVKEIAGTEVYGFEHEGTFLTADPVICQKL